MIALYGDRKRIQAREVHTPMCHWLCDITLSSNEEISREVQNRGISGPTKRTYILQKLKKKATEITVNYVSGLS